MGRELAARLTQLWLSIVLVVLGALSAVLFALTLTSLVLIIVWVGLPASAVCVFALRRLAGVHRRIAARLLNVELPSAYLRIDERGLLAWPLAYARDRSTWRDLAWLPVNAFIGTVLAAVAMVESVLGLVIWLMPRSVMLLIDAQIIRAMLSAGDQALLAARVQQLTDSRAETVDTQAAELRRIERDLHDGAQARMVSVGMSLGMAEERIDADPSVAKRLLAEAREANSQALAELRDLVRGIHPPVLADRGLAGAVQALALTAPIPVALDCQMPGRLPAPLESAAYFAVAEALTNVIKHSGASRASIAITQTDGALSMCVQDDGRGGADPARGSGLRGIERRLGAFDGRLGVSSPPGVGTTVTMELPCVSSSPKTSPSSETA